MQSIGHDRREFIAKSFCLAGGASLAAFGLRPAAAQAQTTPPPIRRSERYDDSFITERKPFKWPGNNTLAIWFAPNVEVWHYDSAFGVGISPNPTNYLPDVFNFFFSSRRRHTRLQGDWSSDVCSSDLSRWRCRRPRPACWRRTAYRPPR